MTKLVGNLSDIILQAATDNPGLFDGPAGPVGPVNDVVVTNNGSGVYTFTFGSGYVYVTPQILGATGDSITVDSVVNNVDNTMTITFSDGSVHTTVSMLGKVGPAGATGPGIHHWRFDSSTDSLGRENIGGEVDTYTLWADALETIGMGSVSTSNGESVFSYATAAGYVGTEVEFQEELSTIKIRVHDAGMHADAAEFALNEFSSVYLGAYTVAPAFGRNNVPLVAGMMYFNTITIPTAMQIYDGAGWVTAVFAASGAVNTFNGRDGAVVLSNTDITNAVGVDLQTDVSSSIQRIGTTTKYEDSVTSVEYKVYISGGELLMEEL